MGSITIDNEDRTVVTLNNVRYMTYMGRNLLSYGQLEQSWCKYSDGDFLVQFKKKTKYQHGLFYLKVKSSSSQYSKGLDRTKKTMAL